MIDDVQPATQLLQRRAESGNLAALCALIRVFDAGPIGSWTLDQFGADDPATVDWVLCQVLDE